MDGTQNKGRLGANSILGVSMAVARAAAHSAEMPLWRYLGGVHAHLLPVPMMNIINGGRSNALDVQEFMVMPIGASHFADGLRMGAEDFYALRKLLSEASLSISVGDEGGFAPAVNSTDEAIGYIMKKAIERAGYKPGDDVMIALDAAASEFCVDGKYNLDSEKRLLTTEQMNAMWREFAVVIPLFQLRIRCMRTIGTACKG